MILMGTGSEVALCVEAYEQLTAEGIAARVVSMPCWELFEEQNAAYRDSVLPPDVTARVGVEAAASFGWDRYLGSARPVRRHEDLRRLGAGAGGDEKLRHSPSRMWWRRRKRHWPRRSRNPVAGFARIRMFAEIDARNSGESRYECREVGLEPVAEPAAYVVHLIGPLLGDLPLRLGQGDFVDIPRRGLHSAGHWHSGGEARRDRDEGRRIHFRRLGLLLRFGRGSEVFADPILEHGFTVCNSALASPI